ncbi:hypothetical protein [Cognatishimia sp. F0-27]|uniref:LIC10280 family protein n=1 Tax=Cognatishimia sp. F0-27 TaxID=2816855 RepID=UPI001D0CD5A7|nr:hypothetical protein [Cognatishimia sp. F0-27]MCC1491596.1 hypothetical protein [Cognatishimia sp. F0-27]
MSLFRRGFLATGLVWAATISNAQSQAPQLESAATALSGSYVVEGRNLQGSAYSGTMTITPDGAGVILRWSIGADSYSGRGVRDGRVLTVDWGDTHPVIYVIREDGALHGTWGNGLALERATPRP